MFEHLIWLEETDSTQRLAKEGDFPPGTVVVANRQSRGRGRLGRVWESPRGGLYFSFTLRDEPGKEVSALPLVLGYSLRSAVGSFGIEAKIKWPNDIYAKGKKLAGILVERTKGRLVVGIGVNVNQGSFPHELEDSAISMRLVAGGKFDRREVLIRALDRISRDLSKFLAEGFGAFKDAVEENMVFLGERVVVISDKRVEGRLKGIDDSGRLLLDTPRGTLTFLSAQVSLRSAGME